jgi:hypothetical protein
MQGLRRSGHRGPSMVNRSQLLTIASGLTDMLNLRRNRRRTPLMQHGGLRRRGPLIDPAASAVEAHVIGRRYIGDITVVNVVNDSGIYIRHGSVIRERAAVPVAALITATGITEPVIHTAIKSDV